MSSSCGSKAEATKVLYTDNPAARVVDEYDGLQDLTQVLPADQLVRDVIAFGRKFLGKPYRYRGPSPWPMDCSGYVSFIFKTVGIDLPRSSRELRTFTQRVKEPRPGDLVFFTGRNARSGSVGHVALVVSNDERGLRMMHSTNRRGIIVETLQSSAYFSRRFIGYGRIPGISTPKPYPQGQGPKRYFNEEDKAFSDINPIPPTLQSMLSPTN